MILDAIANMCFAGFFAALAQRWELGVADWAYVAFADLAARTGWTAAITDRWETLLGTTGQGTKPRRSFLVTATSTEEIP